MQWSNYYIYIGFNDVTPPQNLHYKDTTPLGNPE